jgi:Mce-associated membrane protein
VSSEANRDEATQEAQAKTVAADEPETTAVEPESTAVEEPTSEAGPESSAKGRPGIGKYLGPILLTLLLVVSAGVAAWLYFFQYRVDQQTDADAQNVVLEAATTSTKALLSYAPDTMEQDFTTAKSHLTGDFLNYYTQFTEQIVTPAVKEKQVKTDAAVVQAGVAEMHPESAVVLVFVNQTTVSKENPDGAFAASAVKVGMTKSDGRWLINAFDPV